MDKIRLKDALKNEAYLDTQKVNNAGRKTMIETQSDQKRNRTISLGSLHKSQKNLKKTKKEKFIESITNSKIITSNEVYQNTNRFGNSPNFFRDTTNLAKNNVRNKDDIVYYRVEVHGPKNEPVLMEQK